MSQSLQTVCDICGAVKGESNNWWRAFLDTKALHLWYVQAADKNPPQEAVSDLCSEECCHKALAKWMRERRHAEDVKTPETKVFPGLWHPPIL